MATRGGSEDNLLFRETFAEEEVQATCIVQILDLVQENQIDLEFQFIITVQNTRDHFHCTVRGEITNPILIMAWGSKVLLHYGGCVLFHAGASGFKALKRAYHAAKDSGNTTRSAVVDKLKDEGARVRLEIKRALRHCVAEAVVLGSIL